ncbi:hypothetical protein JCM8097_000903 [Rhodosporidiobolus ruineniae]
MATHHGFLREFPFIRVDAFDGDPAIHNPFTGKPPLFYLLSHAHTDHFVGLDSPHFAGLIYCTPVTRRLLLETMTAADRVRYDELGERVGKNYKHKGLRKKQTAVKGGKGRGMDRIRTLEYNTPTVIPGPDGTSVTVTAIDANHCPGSAMFIVTGPTPSPSAPSTSTTVLTPPISILHTGDSRIEPWHLAALAKNPHLQPFLAKLEGLVAGESAGGNGKGKGKRRATDEESESIEAERRGERCGGFEAIYLDTSAVLLDEELPTKDEAIRYVVELISHYPRGTKFFINSWTWGYEELLKALHRAFDEPIHLDWYKHKIYTSAEIRTSDPLLASLGTPSEHLPSSSSHLSGGSPSLHPPSTSSTSTSPPPARPCRFHACERRWRCDSTWGTGVGCYEWEAEHLPLLEGKKRLKTPVEPASKRGRFDPPEIVYINPAEMPRWRAEAYQAATREKLRRAKERWLETEEGEGKGKKKAMWPSEEREEEEDGGWPTSLIVPLARHSTLPELRRFVALFRPSTIVPLTLQVPTAQHPAYDYQQLPRLFQGCLAEGGEARIAREAERHKRDVVREMKRRGAPGGGAPSSAGQAQVQEGEEEADLGGLVEPAYVKALERKGMNIEGGPEVVREMMGWCARLEPGMKSPEQPRKRGEGRREELAQDSEEEVVAVESSDEDEGEFEEEKEKKEAPVPSTSAAAAAPSTSTSKKPIDFDALRRKEELARRPSPFLDAAQQPSLLPSAPISSLSSSGSSPLRPSLKRLRTPDPTEVVPSTSFDVDGGRKDASGTTTGKKRRKLDKSVTFAASPSPRQPVKLGKAASALPASSFYQQQEQHVSPELAAGVEVIVERMKAPLKPTNSLGLGFSSSSSSSNSPSLTAPAPQPSVPFPSSSSLAVPPPASSPSSSSASSSAYPRPQSTVASGRTITARLSLEGRERRAVIAKALKRSLGRRAEKEQRAALRETQEKSQGRDEQEGRKPVWPSPSSFRTVEASTSPIAVPSA